MGGDIRVSSEVGTGSTFRVKMLLSEVTNPTRIAPVDAPIYGYHGIRKTILVTDDDPTQRDLLRQVLTPLGFILLSAPDGQACLSLAQHCRPICSCWIFPWPAWTAGPWPRSCGRRATIRRVS
jgi:PleD family two-component response regulator